MTEIYSSFNDAILTAGSFFTEDIVHTDSWQGVDISKKPEMAMHELCFFSFDVGMRHEDLQPYRDDIRPNLPWADDHFLERVCGEPLNPGKTWEQWPYAHSADKFRDGRGQFNHNYMERYWPKLAGQSPEGKTRDDDFTKIYASPTIGIRGEYGDLENVISLLANDPYTRQAYMPIFFPEDTGDANPGRKPCTLGYHFFMRHNELHMVYYIRSCDFVRHFRDDIYLTVRLVLWVLDRLRERTEFWKKVRPGRFMMHITSLHMFRNDYIAMKNNDKR